MSGANPWGGQDPPDLPYNRAIRTQPAGPPDLRGELPAGDIRLKPKHTFRGVVMKAAPLRTPAVLKPSATRRVPAAVRVGREVAGRAGKGVSVIRGLPLAAAELEEFATRLKKLCGAGGAVKEGVIEIQGDHRDRLVKELQRLGYDARRSGG